MTSPLRFLAPPMANNAQAILVDDTLQTATLTHNGPVRMTCAASAGTPTAITIGFGRVGDTPAAVFFWKFTDPPLVMEIDASVTRIYHQAFPATPGNAGFISICPA